MLDEIILIDDDKVTIQINTKLIQQVLPKVTIKSFANGEDGLVYLLSSKDDNLKTLVLLDLNMPVMDGFEFLNIYENVIAYQEHSFTVCLLTSSHDDEDYNKSLKFPSVLEYTTKPLNREKVEQIINRATDKLSVS